MKTRKANLRACTNSPLPLGGEGWVRGKSRGGSDVSPVPQPSPFKGEGVVVHTMNVRPKRVGSSGISGMRAEAFQPEGLTDHSRGQRPRLSAPVNPDPERVVPWALRIMRPFSGSNLYKHGRACFARRLVLAGGTRPTKVRPKRVPAILLALAAGMLPAADFRAEGGEPTPESRPAYYDHWESFGVPDGLPSDKVFCIYAGEKDVWAGTDHGLARYSNGQWKTYSRKDGLAHPAVMSIAEDHDTGDMWIGTMGGLNRFSAGRFDTFTQLNSGLANDVVYGVAVWRGEVWAATAAGTSRYQLAADRWTIYNETNTPMHERWCYAAASCAGKMYLAVWGGGLLEYDVERDRWRSYVDPDHEMEVDVFRDDGLVHDVVSAVACDQADRVWVGTYFGLSSYDGRKWRNFMDHDSPLVSNFVNFVTTRGKYAWIGTDKGLNATDRENWWTYRRDPDTGKGTVIWQPAGGAAEQFAIDTIFPHNYVLGISLREKDIWLATEKGVGRGTRSQDAVKTVSPEAHP